MKVLKILVMGLVLGGFLRGEESFSAAVTNAPQTVSGGGVTAKVTYLNPKSGEDPRFQVVLDTHSVTLDGYDLKNLSVLRDEAGRSYPPTGLENKGSGHHREITLVFPKPSSQARSLELVIKDIAGIKERSFRWELSQ